MNTVLRYAFVSLILILSELVALGGGPSAPIRPGPLTPQPKLLEKVPPPVSPGLKLPPGALDFAVIEEFRTLQAPCITADPNVGVLTYRVSNVARVQINQLNDSERVWPVHEASGGPRLEAPSIKDPFADGSVVAYVLVATSPTGNVSSRRISYGFRWPLAFRFLSSNVDKVHVRPEFHYRVPVEAPGFAGYVSEVRVDFQYVAPHSGESPGWIGPGELRPSALGATIFFSSRETGDWRDHAAARIRIGVNGRRNSCGWVQVDQVVYLRADPGYTDAGIPVASTPPPPPPPVTTTACCSSGTPAGYYKTDDSWVSTMCGNPTSIVYNVCSYQRYDDKSIGATMSICNGQPLAPGWVQDATSWIPTRCEHNISGTHNVETVRRIR